MIKRILQSLAYRYKKATEKSKNEWPIDKLVDGAMKCYEEDQGYCFDIYHPELFTEKIIWYKLFYRRQGLENLVDKYLFKSYVNAKLGSPQYTIPLLGAWESTGSFKKSWESLPNSFVLKSTLKSDSQFIIVVKDKKAENVDRLCSEMKAWLNPKNTLINSYCYAYYNAKPRIIAEQYLSSIDEQLYDYKFLCFNGAPKYIYTYENRFSDGESPSEDYALTYYDTNWNKQDAIIGGHPTGEAPKPKHFDEMMQLSAILSNDLPFVRVDFYEFEDRVYVGELTLYPHGGLLTYEPREFNKLLGDCFVLPIESTLIN